MARVTLDWDDKKLRSNIQKLDRRINGAVAATVDRNAAWGQGWLRANAPWTDRTGAARGGMFAFPSSAGGHHEIYLTYSVHYGIWLEIANSGKYQVMIPGIRVIGHHLMGDLRNLLGRL